MVLAKRSAGLVLWTWPRLELSPCGQVVNRFFGGGVVSPDSLSPLSRWTWGQAAARPFPPFLAIGFPLTLSHRRADLDFVSKMLPIKGCLGIAYGKDP